MLDFESCAYAISVYNNEKLTRVYNQFYKDVDQIEQYYNIYNKLPFGSLSSFKMIDHQIAKRIKNILTCKYINIANQMVNAILLPENKSEDIDGALESKKMDEIVIMDELYTTHRIKNIQGPIDMKKHLKVSSIKIDNVSRVILNFMHRNGIKYIPYHSIEKDYKRFQNNHLRPTMGVSIDQLISFILMNIRLDGIIKWLKQSTFTSDIEEYRKNNNFDTILYMQSLPIESTAPHETKKFIINLVTTLQKHLFIIP